MIVKIEGDGIWRPFSHHHLHHGRNNFAGFFDNNSIPHTNVLPRDFFLIVESGPGNGAAGNQHGFQFRHRRQHSGPAYLDGDGLQLRLHAFRRILVSHGPAWSLRSHPQLLLRGSGIHFENRAIRFVVQSPAVEIQLQNSREGSVQGFHPPNPVRRAQAHLFHQGMKIAYRQQFHPLHLSEAMEDDIEGPLCSDARVQLLQGAGSCVPGIGKPGISCRLTFIIQKAECTVRHENFAPYFQQGRGPRGQVVGETADCPDIFCDIVAGSAISPGRRILEPTTFITNGNSHPVHLGLDQAGDPASAQRLYQPLPKGPHLIRGISVIETHHPHRMGNLRETVQWSPTHPPCR